MSQHLLLAFLWIIYCVLHSVLANLRVKEIISKALGKGFQYFRLFYTLFAAAGFIGILWYQLQMETTLLWHQTDLIFWSGIVVTSAGGIVMLICIRKYFIHLSGIRTLYSKVASNELQITGIHKHIRHPLYLGTFIFIWGLLLVIPVLSLLISNAVITVYTLIAIRFEEEKLEKEFGDSYRQYKLKVPKLIPSRRNHL